jgi:very-short-patch-repair endonuclease
VIRFTNEEVYENAAKVAMKIKEVLDGMWTIWHLDLP